MDPNPLLRQLTAATRAHKQAVVHANGIGTDIPSTLLTLQRGQHLGAYRGEHLHQRHERVALAHTAIALSNADTAVFITEQYVLDNDDSHEWLGQRFAAGDPAVHEALCLIVVTNRGHVSVGWDPYRYQGKQVEWLTLNNPSPELTRELVQIAHADVVPAFEAQAQRNGPPLLGTGSHIHLLGSQQVNDDQALVHFALCNTCPCGSGRAMNDCCAARN